MTLVTSVGGASGPLYGTFFLRAATAAGDATSLDGPALLAALRAGLDGIVARGKAEAGDKTMYDALAPALDAFEAALGSGADVGRGRRARPPTLRPRGATPPSRCSPSRGGPAISASAASATSTPAPRRRRCCWAPSPTRWREGDDMIGIVVVSHSPALAEAAVALADEMVHGAGPGGGGGGRGRRGGSAPTPRRSQRRSRRRPRPTAYSCSWTSVRPCSAPSWRSSSAVRRTRCGSARPRRRGAGGGGRPGRRRCRPGHRGARGGGRAAAEGHQPGRARRRAGRAGVPRVDAGRLGAAHARQPAGTARPPGGPDRDRGRGSRRPRWPSSPADGGPTQRARWSC